MATRRRARDLTRRIGASNHNWGQIRITAVDLSAATERCNSSLTPIPIEGLSAGTPRILAALGMTAISPCSSRSTSRSSYVTSETSSDSRPTKRPPSRLGSSRQRRAPLHRRACRLTGGVHHSPSSSRARAARCSLSASIDSSIRSSVRSTCSSCRSGTTPAECATRPCSTDQACAGNSPRRAMQNENVRYGIMLLCGAAPPSGASACVAMAMTLPEAGA